MRKLSVVLFALAVLALPAAAVEPRVGFFAPDGIPRAVAEKTQIGLFNAGSPAQVAQNLNHMRGTHFKAYIDLGPIITRPSDPTMLRMRYTTGDGTTRRKVFKPGKLNKLRVFPSDAELRRELAPLMPVLKKYASNVGAVFLADEPYLNGISKAELERAGRLVRTDLDSHGLRKVKLGVIFASGMFNSAFAHLMDDQAGIYAEGIDDYYRKGEAHPKDKGFVAWVNTMETMRLATYDRAGNMYTGGGLPQGFDIYGYDFYLSTLLLDGLHQHTLSWFAQHYPGNGCSQFAGQTMSALRRKLSFFHSGSVLRSAHLRARDRKLLDAIYLCRMGAVTVMLRNAAGGLRHAKFLLVSESSNNGVLEFDSNGSPEPDQPELLVEARVLDEVHRAERFYAAHANVYTAGLLFFTYKNTYDKSIKLAVGGASAMPAVMRSIYRFAASPVAPSLDPTVVPAVVPVAKLSVVPGSVSDCQPNTRVISKVSWRVDVPSVPSVKVMVNNPGETQSRLFSQGGRKGEATTGDWVMAGTRFDLINANDGAELANYTVTGKACRLSH